MASPTRPGGSLPARARVAAARLVIRLPAPLRQRLWRARRGIVRRRRTRLEAHGDQRLSRPALHGMDRRLEELFDGRPGYFVEAGANDGYTQSNTYALERLHGWRGLLVEPVPELHREATRARPGARVVNCALVPFGHPEPTVTLRYGGLMTVTVGARGSDAGDRAWVAAAHAVAQEEPEHELTVPARTLSSLLDEQGSPEVDLLSLDVEGFEPQVLAGLDLDRHGPRFVLVEIREPETGRAPVEAVLGARYALREALSPYDLLYERTDS